MATRLDQFVAQSGLCARRKSKSLIRSGDIFVNKKRVTYPSYPVQGNDQVSYKGDLLQPQEKKYLLLYKKQGYITSCDDERKRLTVLDLLPKKLTHGIFPVGRLDRATTGLLLLTNDGHFAQKLAHPSFQVKKSYHVHLERSLALSDLEKIKKGVKLTDGFLRVDHLSYIKEKSYEVVIHSGKNRVLRRLFSALGYKVKRLHRFSYGIFNLKGMQNGGWRHLKKTEVNRVYDSLSTDLSANRQLQTLTKNSFLNKENL